MATITVTLDRGQPDYSRGRISGTFASTEYEGGTASQIAVDQIVLLPTTAYLTAFEATCEDGPATVRAKCNTNSAGSAVNGTVLIETNSIGSQTFRFFAHFLGS